MKTNAGKWYVDSCSSAHITNMKIEAQNDRNCGNMSIAMANKDTIPVKAIGDVKVPVMTESGIEEITVKNVKYAPESAANLLSVSRIVNKGFSVMFTPEGSYINDSEGTRIAIMSQEDGIYKLNTPKEKVYYAAETPDVELWHKRLGHLNYRSVIALSKNPATEIKINNTEMNTCVSCIKGKQHRQPFPHSKTKSKELLQLVHSDVCGPMENTSIGGSRYILTFIDDFSKKTFVYFLQEKRVK